MSDKGLHLSGEFTVSLWLTTYECKAVETAPGLLSIVSRLQSISEELQ
jgi:hypothetical protein